MCFLASFAGLFKNYMSVKCDLDAKKFDLLTITAADYAVEMNITSSMNKKFVES